MPVDYVSGLGQLPDPAGDLQNAIAFKIGLDRSRLQQHLGELEVQEAQRKAEQRRVFDEDWKRLGSNPTPQAISDMVMRYPEMAGEIKTGWDIRDEAVRRADLTQLGEIFTLGQKGQWDQAAVTARRRLEADKAAGQADEGDEQVVAMLESGDPEQQKAALAVMGTHLAAVTGPQHFGSVFGKVQEGDGFTLAPGSARYDSDGNVIAERPFAPRALTVGDGQTIIEYNPGSGGGGGSGTPRGIRNNNPGNIRDGSFAQSQPGYKGRDSAGFAIFDNATAGTDAQARLLAGSYIGKGFDTPESIVERYAPAGENSPESRANYKAHIAKSLGIGVNDRIPVARSRELAHAMAGFENGTGGGPKVIAQGKAKPVKVQDQRVVNGVVFVKIDGKWFQKKAG